MSDEYMPVHAVVSGTTPTQRYGSTGQPSGLVGNFLPGSGDFSVKLPGGDSLFFFLIRKLGKLCLRVARALARLWASRGKVSSPGNYYFQRGDKGGITRARHLWCQLTPTAGLQSACDCYLYSSLLLQQAGRLLLHWCSIPVQEQSQVLQA